MIRDLVGPGCAPNSRNPLGNLVDQFESVSRVDEKGELRSEPAPASEIEAVQADRNRLRDRTSIFARQFGDHAERLENDYADSIETYANQFKLSQEESDAYRESIRKQLETFSLDVRKEDLTHFHDERSDLWAQEMSSYLDRNGLEAMANHQMTPEDLMREFPYQFQENNLFVAAPTTADDAIKLYENGDLGDAVLALEALVQRQPENSTAWRWLGTVHAENDEDKLAIASLLRAFQADPENLDALLDLGVSFTNELAQHQALNYLKMWIEKHPRYSSIASRMTFSEEDSGLLGFQRMHRKVTDMFLMAAEMNPRDANVYTVLGVLYNLSREFDKAEKAFRSGLEVDPRNYSLWNKLGATQANSTHVEGSKEAVFAYRKALELKPNYVRAWVNMGISYANQGKNQVAVRYYTKALIQNTTAEHVWGYLRVAFSVMGNEIMAERAAARDLTLLQEPSLI